MRFVVGADFELGGKKIRLMALTENDRIVELDSAEYLIMPSAFCYDKEKSILYVVDELNNGMGKVVLFKVTDTKLILLQTVKTNGSNPCHVAIDYQRKILYVSHFAGGGIVCYNLQKNGWIAKNPLFVMNEKKTFHSVLPLDDGFIALNTDDGEIVHSVYSMKGIDYVSTIIKVPSPRQAICVNKRKAVIVCENESIICNYDLAMKKIIQCISACVSEGLANKAASIWLSTRDDTIIVSNRGEDSLVAFDINKSDDGILRNPRLLLSGVGRCPRDFDIDYGERYAVIGFTESNCVSVYKINKGISRTDLVATIEVNAPIGIQVL